MSCTVDGRPVPPMEIEQLSDGLLRLAIPVGADVELEIGLLTAGTEFVYVPARRTLCEGARHVAPRMYLGLDARWYIGGTVQVKCPSCHQPLPSLP